MAKVQVKWSRSGYSALMNSSEVQRDLDRRAERIKNAATAQLSPDNFRKEPFKVVKFKGKLASGRVIRPSNVHGARAQAKNKVLTKAISAGG